MQTLFFMILTTVFTLGYLIAPDQFKISTEEIMAPTAEPTMIVRQLEDHPVDASVNPVQYDVPVSPTGDPSEMTPQSIFGSAKTEDIFERGSSGFGINAGLNDDENIRIIALNKRLSLEPKKDNGWITWRLRPPTVKDSAADMEFSIITCARGDRTGILMRSSDYTSGHGYYFSLSCEGTISILRDSTVLDTADARGVFNNNSSDVNVLTAMARGNVLSAYLNGQHLLSVRDDAYAEGFSGFFTAPQGQNTLTMDLLSFKEYYSEEVK